jgi:hypothetical protein
MTAKRISGVVWSDGLTHQCLAGYRWCRKQCHGGDLIMEPPLLGWKAATEMISTYIFRALV